MCTPTGLCRVSGSCVHAGAGLLQVGETPLDQLPGAGWLHDAGAQAVSATVKM